MYVNKCTKCGVEFETKNPKRIICPACLYPDRSPLLNNLNQEGPQEVRPEENRPQPFVQRQNYSQPENREPGGFQNRTFDNRFPQQGASFGGGDFRRPPQQGEFRRPPQQGGFNRPPQQGEFRRPPMQGGFYSRPQHGEFRIPRKPGPPQHSGFGGGRPPKQGGFRRPPMQGGGFRRPQSPRKQLLISREQVAQIEVLYKRLLPLPNPDAHEEIGKEIELESNKVFFGINLVRQKLRLPKLPFPKRKLALTIEQVMAIRTLYEPLLPLPPIGCHKIIAKQLKIDEWRVHVGIGIIRKQMNLPRWNAEREDAPEEFKKQLQEAKKEE